jgi:mannosyl-3-phosphoglycerate phosphatase
MKSVTPVVVFADVEQTFLANVPSRRFSDAEAMLADERVALVLSSSMTRAELEVCQQELGVRHPFICESGAAVLVPHRCFPFEVPRDRDLAGYHLIEFGRPYADVVALLHRTASRLGIDIVGFSDLSVEQVATVCGLTLSRARLAKLREYDEPFRLINETPDGHGRLWRALRSLRLGCTHRSTYEHVGAAVDKGTGVNVLAALYRRGFGSIVTVGLGNAVNSAALLKCVEWPVVVNPPPIGRSRRSMLQIPPLDVAANHSAWIKTILEIARHARERRPSTLRASAAG